MTLRYVKIRGKQFAKERLPHLEEKGIVIDDEDLEKVWALNKCVWNDKKEIKDFDLAADLCHFWITLTAGERACEKSTKTLLKHIEFSTCHGLLYLKRKPNQEGTQVRHKGDIMLTPVHW